MNQAKFMNRERAAYTKIDQYNSNPGAGGGQGQYGHPHAPLGYNNGSQSGKMKGSQQQYDPGQLDSFSKYNLIPGNAEKQHLSQSSGFSTFDTFSLRNAGHNPEPLRLDQMVTLSVFKSTSGQSIACGYMFRFAAQLNPISAFLPKFIPYSFVVSMSPLLRLFLRMSCPSLRSRPS